MRWSLTAQALLMGGLPHPGYDAGPSQTEPRLSPHHVLLTPPDRNIITHIATTHAMAVNSSGFVGGGAAPSELSADPTD
jgi:hypothetical protein